MKKWLSDPPPEHLFEMSEFALSFANSRLSANVRSEILNERGLMASPLAPNVIRPQLYRDALTKSGARGGKRPQASLVIPDYAVRMAILDFEEFPSGEEERIALLRFRLRKSVPFPIDEARLSYSLQLAADKKVEVLVAAIARPILEDYERIFLDSGYRLGVVLPSLVATLPLCRSGATGLTLLAKASGYTLSTALLEPDRVRLIRCVDLASGEEAANVSQEPASPAQNAAAMMPLMQQTLAYAEDQLSMPVARVLLAGFEHATQSLGTRLSSEFGVPYAPLHSRFGSVASENCGLHGMLEKYAA